MTKVFPAHIINRSKPANFETKDLKIFEQDFSQQVESFEVTTERNADILGDTVFSAKMFRFHFKATHLFRMSLVTRIRRLILFLLPYKKADQGIWIIDNWSHNYYHWFCEALPRLIVADSTNKDFPVLLPYYYGHIPFVTESLRLLGKEVVYYDTKKRYRIGELLIAGHTAPSGYQNCQIINELRQKISGSNIIEAGRKIYISRRKAPKRKIIREHEVEKLFLQYGFEIHCFEDYSLIEQINIMRGASCLAGLHGAGLTNMLFMNEGGKVLELRVEGDTHHNCYYALASCLGIHYFYLTVKGDGRITHYANVSIDINMLERTLALL